MSQKQKWNQSLMNQVLQEACSVVLNILMIVHLKVRLKILLRGLSILRNTGNNGFDRESRSMSQIPPSFY